MLKIKKAYPGMDMRQLIQKEKTLSFGEGTWLQAGAFPVYSAYSAELMNCFIDIWTLGNYYLYKHTMCKNVIQQGINNW
ncbi:hypothetical protein [Chitinophaga sp.]|uniref:hypothetical protein n=1 Tax=Chitinophaga sp. TaxID=1869181 RepID=UPI0031D2B61C